jgi:subtilisin family serine protease
VLILDLDAKEAAAKRQQLPPDVIVEEEKLRWHGSLHAHAQLPMDSGTFPHGSGAAIELQVMLDAAPLEAAVASLLLVDPRGGFTTTSTAVSDASGRAVLLYDPKLWFAFGLTVEPRSRAWTGYTMVTATMMELALTPLPRSGPLGWWHTALGLSRHSGQLGTGIRVGIIDTGIGPHPYLAHAKRAGAITEGRLDPSPDAADDVAEHGSHVAGTIGARPTDLRDFAGIAPAAELVALRVYPGGGGPGSEGGFATNGDIAQAITRLSRDEMCDIVNLSSNGPLHSEIEADRITAAFNRGTLLVCSAGNGGGPPVLFPAAEPNAVGVSALGFVGAAPLTALDAFNMPTQQDRYTMGGGYLAKFSSFGPEIKCIAPGVGIVSTVPTKGESYPAYLGASGTSMAAPVVTGCLAALLSQDSVYKTLPRTRERSVWAWNVLARSIRSLGLNFQYQGLGLPTVLT